MEAEAANPRPNIRIQIVNNVAETSVEKMEVDTEQNEEGEIVDNADEEISENIGSEADSKAFSATEAVFTTGINIFDENEQKKLHERARRFALKPDEIHSFSDQELQDLYESLGINPTNESEVKFETVHLLGLGDMKAEDVVDYFAGYAPKGIEWIDNNCCNVVWLDNLSAARALHFKSKIVRGMPAREPKQIFPKEFLDDLEESVDETGQSILVKNQNREIELQNEIGEIILPKKKVYPKNSVDISEITIPIPPGYWRLGNPHPKTKCLLVRFGRVTDKLPFKSEKCSKYYKKLSNPSQRNVISENKKKELRSIFERNKELNQSKNPWGSLAKNWDKDARFREREPIMYNLEDKSNDDVQVVEIKNPKLLARLGTKRKLESEEKDTDDNSETFKPERKRIKVPRMKMYADEEEENRKRKKILMTIKKQAEEIERRDDASDLRNMLGPTNRLVMKKDLPPIELNTDLGTRLKNRSQRMVFAVERDPLDEEEYYNFETRPLYSDVNRELVTRDHVKYIERERERQRSPIASRLLMRSRMIKDRVSERHSDKDVSSRRRALERTLHSDRIHSSRSSHSTRRRKSYSPEGRQDKPKSKVAVVIKTPKKPAVASTIWSKVKEPSSTESESEESDNSSSQGSSSSSDSGSESEDSDGASDSSTDSVRRRKTGRNPDRPGFDKSRLSHKVDHRSPLKITTANEHFNHRKLRK